MRYRNTRRIVRIAVWIGVAFCLLAQAQAAPGAKKAASLKKGFDTVVRPDGRWREQVTALRAHWFYSWGGDEPANLPAGVQFVPMDWGYYGNKDNGLMRWLAKVKAQPHVHALLDFNEPDGREQANLTVDKALEGWPYLMRTGLTLGSPAAVHADGDWMKAFMAGVEKKHYRVDFITVHWYGGADPQGFLGYLARVHALYQRPLWVTEFAPADWSGHRGVSPQQAADFMRVALPGMDRLDYVQRYAWFSAAPEDAALGASALFQKDGSLTDLGRLYASL